MVVRSEVSAQIPPFTKAGLGTLELATLLTTSSELRLFLRSLAAVYRPNDLATRSPFPAYM
jgi:hypothetical protein